MAAPNIKDLATSLVAVAPVPATTGVTLTITHSQATRLPSTPFLATMVPDNTLPTLDNAEQVTVTGVSGDVLTFTRAYGNTTAKSIAVGWRIFAGPVSAHITGAYTYTDAETSRAEAAEAILVPKTTAVNGHPLTADVTIVKADINLGNVDNTSDANKPVSTAQATALALKAPLASPALTGTPTAPTPTSGTNTTQVATTAFVEGEIVANATPDATTSAKGKVQLAGDLGGTAASPKVKRTTRFIVAPYGDTRPADYTCASSTGNEVEINQAITAANALTNGGVVDLLDGTFTVSHPIVPLNNVWLRGQGMFNTKVTSVSSYNNHLIDNYSVHSPGSPWQNAIISDLELDGSNMISSVASKGINSTALVNCKFMRIYCHNTTATGLGADDYQSVTITECIVNNCGYTNKRTVSAISWLSNTLTVTTSAAHGYSIGSVILLTGFVPIPFNGRYVVTTVIDATNFTIGTSNNSNTNNLTINPGTATTLGNTSDSLIGHNGIGIASGSLPAEAMIITNNYCSGNNNNNFLAEADTIGTGSNASYIFANNISVSAGQNGYLSTGTPNVQFNNNYDYGSQSSFQINQTSASRTITAASWLAGVATYTINTAYTYTLGQKIAITGMTPSGYNGYFTIVSQPTSTTYTVAITSDPGTATVFGTGQVVTHPTDGCQVINNISINAGLYGVRLPSLSDGVQVEGNVIEGCYNYGVQINSSNSSVSNNRIYGSGRDGVFIVTGSGDIAPMHHVRVENNHVYNNGQRVSTSPGIELQSTSNAALNDIKVSGNISYDNQDTPTQYYGIIVRSSGTLSNVDITNNDFSGNASGTLLIQYTGNGVSASNNIGANPIGKSELGTVTGTVSIDRKLASFYTMTLGGNISASFPSGLVKGSELTVIVTQDGTGSRTVSWSGLISWGNGGAPTLSTTASAVDRFTFRWDGTNWLEAARVLGYAASVSGTAGGDLTGTYPNPTLVAAGTAGTYAYPSSVTTDSKGRVTSVTANTGSGSGSVVLQVSPTITTPMVAQLNDGNGNPYLSVSAVASAIAGFQITNAISGGTVTLANVNTGNSATIFKGSGTGLMATRPGTDSTNSWRLQNAAGTSTIIAADSSNLRINVGSATAPTSTLQSAGSFATAIVSKSANYTATGTDSTILGDATTAGFTITLPTAVGIGGRFYLLKKIDSSTNAVTIGTTSSQTIEASTTYSLATQNQHLIVVSDNANWRVFASNSGTDLAGAVPITLGGTGAITASAARTALGVAASGANTDITSITGSAATLTTSRNIDGQAFNGSADITVIAPGTHAATSKTTPVDADELPLVDSAASNVLKKLTWANLKATIKSYYDAVTSTLTNKTYDTAGTGNSFSINGVAVTANTGTGAVARAAGPTFTTPTLGAASATTVAFSATPTAGTVSSNIITMTSAETQAVGDLVQINSSGNAHLAKADAIANASAVLIAAGAVSGSASNTYLLPGGILRLSASPAWTKGGIVYLSATGTTGNTLTQTAPSATGNVIQPVGIAIAADTLLFNPSLSQVEHS